MKTKKFTILHSNDMHGDFLAQGGLEEWFRNHQNITRKIERRLVFKK